MKKMILLAVSLTATMSVFANPYELREMANRVKPVGQVKVAGMASDNGDADKPAEKAKPLTGPEVYNKYCVACHGAGIAGAPKYKDAGAWAARKKQGLATMVKHAIHGLNAMPPKGTCSECTDEQIKAAVQHMIP